MPILNAMKPSSPTDPVFFSLLSGSYERFLGRSLTPPGMAVRAAAQWLYEEAPFALLAHDSAADPLFVYGNLSAQKRFEYDWNALTNLPSRLSAEAPHQEERRRFLERVERDGYVEDYSGVRVSSTGQRFRIEGATVWQLTDAEGRLRGQAAMIPHSSDLQSA